MLRVHLPASKRNDLFDEEVRALVEVDRSHPFVMASDREGRERLTKALAVNTYSIHPEAKRTMEEAIDEGLAMATPITPVTDYELLAYVDDVKTLVCAEDRYGYEKGKRYRITSYSYTFTDIFKRNKAEFDTSTGFNAREHECRLKGKDRALRVWKNRQQTDFEDFLARPDARNGRHHHESEVWEVFERPTIQTVAEKYPGRMKKNYNTLATLEAMAGFTYYPGQPDYLARIGCKSFAYVVAEPGCGKTNFAISLIGLKGANRALIIAPQGTVKGEPLTAGAMSASQWAEEIEKFAPTMPVFELFKITDYYRILREHRGVLPHGIYVTYFQAFFQNGAAEKCTRIWTNTKIHAAMGEDIIDDGRDLCESVGHERGGIRSICKPSMSTLIGHHFDMICVDEAHIAQTATSQVTEMLIRLQPKYRFAFSATPIPNDVSNLFSVMGWLCVPDWYKGHRCNAAFPFSRQDLKRFQHEFMSTERDMTALGKPVSTVSPVISSPTHLLKILKSTMAFIAKEDCNPDYIKPEVIDIRVDMGMQQANLYQHYMDKKNVSGLTPGIRATNQVTTLRSVCAEAHESKYNNGLVTSPFNPKIVAVMEVIRDKLRLEEQVVIISSRTSTNDMIEELLRQAGIKISRIDSKRQKHSKEAATFKSGRTRVLLMGIKCAAAHSFPKCRNLIITSIEWSNGVFRQALGRVDRINSLVVPNIYVMLYRNSIEEVMFDMMTIRDDSAQLCIKGVRNDTDRPTPIDLDEILAESIVTWTDAEHEHDERRYEREWSEGTGGHGLGGQGLRGELKLAALGGHRNVQVVAAKTY